MSRFISLIRCIQTLRQSPSFIKTDTFHKLPVRATSGLCYTFHRQCSSAADNEQETSTRSFLSETHANARHKKSKQEKASLVIFDKDGTLICFHTMWSTWVVQVTESIAKRVGLSIENKLYETLGVCAKSKKIFPGLLAEMTTSVIQKELIDLLVKEGVTREKAEEAVVQSWKEGDSGLGEHIKSIHPDLRTLFKLLKAENIKIAICTADNRRGTMNTLRNLGLTQYVDMVVCGDDPLTQPKPSPHNALKICEALGVDPKKAAMVGDTKADVGMGHNARLGWVIGVLSGVGDTRDLLPEANYIIDNVKDLLPLILPYKNWVNYYTYKSDERVLREPAELLTGAVPTKEIINMDSYKVVIFDLHGTLVSSHDKHSEWLDKLINRLESKTGLKLATKIYQSIGVSQETKKVWKILQEKEVQTKMKENLVELLREEGFHYEEAIITINQALKDCESILQAASSVVPDKDTQLLFHTLKKNGIKVAINTSVSRETAVNDLKAVGLTSYIDIMVCGGDPMSRYKPDPHNALLICEEVGTTPEKAVVVGDTIEDITMGLNAKVGLTIGVLTGVGSRAELVQSDHIVSSVSDILHHLKSKQNEKSGGNIVNSGSIQCSKYQISPSSSSNKRLFSTLSFLNMQQFCHRSFSTNSQHLSSVKSKYDYVIVGAGSAGCVLANRLTEDGKSSVLLVEAGPGDKSWKIRMPAALMYNLCDDKYNWYYHTQPEPGMNNRIMYQPRGRVLGGSSSLNAMVYIRGHAKDYDRWEQEGAKGWAYANCLPYFRKSQTHELGPNEYRGGEGPLHVSRGKTNHPLHHAFLEATLQAGYLFTDDMNGFQQEGFGWMDMTIHNGKRWSMVNAYLSPALPRKNLSTITEALVSRVLFSGRRAIGISFEHHGKHQSVEAEKEVILCGGAINSPQLLQLSGVGDSNLIKSLDIPLIHHLPGVGKNLQDHLEIYVQQTCTKPITLYSAQWKFPHNMIRIGAEWFLFHTGYAATSHLETGGFIRSASGISHPNIQFHFLPSTVNDHGRKVGPCHAYQVHVGTMRPTSKGHVTIQSKDPRQHPAIIFNYLTTADDVNEFHDGIKLAREIFAQKAFDEFRGPELAPGKDVISDKQLDEFSRKMADSAYHPSSTCKMGCRDDPSAVVDPNCNVIGLEGLRVVDASIMPSVISGNLNGPTVMIAEKAADIIRGRGPLPISTAPVWQPADINKQR